MDIFDKKNLDPMLIGENQPAFDNPDYIFELKLDGIRCLAYIDDNGIELQNKRSKRLNNIYPELKDIHKYVKEKCILDGEIFVMKDGKIDFFEIQKRSLMSKPIKIDLASKKYPVLFTAFDILYYKSKQITELPLIERKKILEEVIIKETSQFAISRYIQTKGIEFFDLAKKQGLEGIVAKHKDSKYYFGKRTKDWIKMKALLDEDFIICGYYINEKNTASIILGVYEENKLIYQSHVSMGISKHDFQIISSMKEIDNHLYNKFPDYEDVKWIKPELVCTVEFMERTPQGGLRQPIYKGLRDDKKPEECIV